MIVIIIAFKKRWCLHMTAVLIVATVGVYSLVMKYVLNHVSKPHPVHK
jgi:hypothetical protein